MIIGTAGHIDHGKTSLVKALTGVDTDRLKEEKARGITIDLGFAYLPLSDGLTLGFIDVPGHERLVHTMLAGAGGIDFMLLAVAADDGVMPQTREHLAILQLLGIERGVVALTKSDIAPERRLAEVKDQVRSTLAGTPFATAEILSVSARTGAGVADLRLHLEQAAQETRRHPEHAEFRLAVDRVFTLAGVGLVVTGTVLSGIVRVGDPILVSPSGLPARVRSVHAQNRPAEIGKAGDRCALNLVGEKVAKGAIHRGDVVLAPNLHAPSDRIDARLSLLAGETKPIRQWFPARLHHAAGEVGARIVLLDDQAIGPGGSADVQLVLDRPIAAAIPDRFVIRDTSARRTIGGGFFLDLRPPARGRRSPERQAQRRALAITEPWAAFAALLETPPYARDINTFARDHALPPAQLIEAATASNALLLNGGASLIAIADKRWRAFVASLTAWLTGFHAENPDLQGIGREKLRLSLPHRLPAEAFVVALQKLAEEKRIALDGAFVRLATHTVRLTERDERNWKLIAPLLGGVARFRPPRVRDISAVTGLAERDVRQVLKLAARLGRADEIAHDHFFLRSTMQEMTGIAARIAADNSEHGFTAAQFRDQLENGRKVSIQILEFLDRHGVTLKRDDHRRINRHRLDLFGPVMHSFAGD
ncbi:MAG TPA: selenocysteine-specific translation elongation factor [Rhizomicrobium sp.]|jgi:selenocysteine-specific elongation factor